MRKLLVNNEQLYKITSYAFNILLILALIFIAIYLAAPLLGGKLLVNAIIPYASWIGMALAGKIVLKRVQKGLRIRWYDYALICLVAIVNLVIWFTYPFSIILSVLCIIGVIVSYIKQDSRLKMEQ